MSLDAVTDQHSALVRFTGSGEFYGEVTKDSFSIRPHSVNIKRMKPPLINGRFQPTENGTDVIVDIDIPKGNVLPLAIVGGLFLTVGCTDFTYNLISAGWENAIYQMLTAVLVSAFCAVFLYLGVIRPIRRSMKVFDKIFK